MNTARSHTSLSLVLTFFIIAFIFQSCSKWTMPAELVGTWSGKNTVTFRTKDASGNQVFITQEIPVRIVIQQDERLEGTVGDATFIDCRIARNRNWLEKLFGLSTEYKISDGTLRGRISDKDPFAGKEIMVPFDLKGGKIRGTIFLHKDGEKFPLVDLALSKE